jgi:hypothetical protein
MTPSPVSPTPVVGPINVSGGTGNWSSSGQAVASGPPAGSVGGSFSGPHYIEEQEMTVQYYRYPTFQFQNLSPQDISLSATFPVNTVASGSIATTRIACKVEASVKVVKSYDRFNTSSFQQPQKFQVLATSADALGNTYGVVPQGALGPAGKIVTSQKFYNRRAWESTDVEVSEQLTGYSIVFEVSATTRNNAPYYLKSYTPTANPEAIFGQTWASPDWNRDEKYPEIAGYEIAGKWKFNYNGAGSMTGPFKSPNDQAQYVIDLLNIQGLNASTGYGLVNPDIAQDSTSLAEARGSLNLSSTHYCPSYDASRHDYS